MSMSDMAWSGTFAPDSDEVHCFAELTDLTPTTLTRVLRDPEHLGQYLKPEERRRLVDGLLRLRALQHALSVALDRAVSNLNGW